MLTNETYFSEENNMAYMGHSQFLAFERCEAAALAELRGEYTPPGDNKALLIGGYVDAAFSGELPMFKATHPEIFKRDGSLKADFQKAEEVIDRMSRDRLYMMLMSGKNQIIKTGTIAGVPFKIKIDSLLTESQCDDIVSEFPETKSVLALVDGAIVDQKVMRDMEPIWNPEIRCKESFIEHWGYDIQGAIYQAIDGRNLPFILAVGTKEESPDLAAITIGDEYLKESLHHVEEMAPRYQAIKEGKIEPHYCGHCPYCRSRKHLEGIINYKEME